jgi:hypothetical protein
MFTKIWRWIRGPEPTVEEVVEAEQLRHEAEERHEKVVDEYYEQGFPSREVVKGSLWIP